MGLTQKLDLRLGQHLVMTPQLRQAIKLLEMPHDELAAYVEGELERNPCLEKAEDNVFSFPTPPASTGSPHETGERQIATERTLREHLEEQARLDIADRSLLSLVLHLVGHLDEKGYLATPLAEIAAGLRVSSAHLEEALLLLQRLDPPGIGARDLAECLALQLRERNRLDPLMRGLLTHLDLVARAEHEKLRALLGVNGEDLADMLDELRGLNPRPGLQYGTAPLDPAEPDVLVSRGRNGWIIELNPRTLPRLILNEDYRIEAGRGDGAMRNFVAPLAAQASWLIRALDQRARSILRVAEALVAKQEAFLLAGVHALKPLLRKDLAGELGLHESTISRIAAHKTMLTPRGVIGFSDLFSVSLASESGEVAAAKAVKARVRALIEQEKIVLSDARLVERLREMGIHIARRTVTKYRESLNIPSSAQRRRQRRGVVAPRSPTLS